MIAVSGDAHSAVSLCSGIDHGRDWVLVHRDEQRVTRMVRRRVGRNLPHRASQTNPAQIDGTSGISRRR